MANAQKNILLTGTGTIGGELLLGLLRRTHHRVSILVRDRGRQKAEPRAARLFKQLGVTDAEQARVEVLRGDVTQDNFAFDSDTLARLIETLDVIIHTAATTSLTSDRALCDEVNRKGTANALTLAGACFTNGRLERYAHLSTAFVAGGGSQMVAREDELPDAPQHLNGYEWSKYEAERIVRVAMRAGLPVTIFRPSMVVGSTKDGFTRDFNVIYPLLRIMSSGYATQFPADPRAFVHLAPIDFVVDGILKAIETEWTIGKTFNLTAPAPPTVADLFASQEFFPAGAPRPQLVEPQLFDLTKLPARERDVLETVAFSFPYFNSRLTFETANTTKLVPPPVTDRAFIDRLGRFAVESGYLRHTIAECESRNAELKNEAETEGRKEEIEVVGDAQNVIDARGVFDNPQSEIRVSPSSVLQSA